VSQVRPGSWQDGHQRLAEAVGELGGLVAEALTLRNMTMEHRPGLAQIAASGPRAAADREGYELVVEAVREGYRLHYARAHLFPDIDRDLALLAGDQLYAMGLARLAAMGDLLAIGELADVISLCAQAHAAGAEDLPEAIWDAGAVAVGWGSSPALEAAKARARRGEPGAVEALRAAARQHCPALAPVR
jgi:hypothetical protein